MICLSQYIQEDFKISRKTKMHDDKSAHNILFNFLNSDSLSLTTIARKKQTIWSNGISNAYHITTMTALYIDSNYPDQEWSQAIYVMDEKYDNEAKKLFLDLESVRTNKMEKRDFIKKWYVEQDDENPSRFNIINNISNVKFVIEKDVNLS